MSTISNEGETLLIDKPYQWTSFDVVRVIKKNKNISKVGHAGTLDPLATGLLIVCTGSKTKTIQYIQDAEKEYTGTFYIGANTPSFDLETEKEVEHDISAITAEQILAAVSELSGEQMQTPPMYSAIKLQGKRAYELARKGETAELKSRPIHIKVFEITKIELPLIDFRIVCTKGTYIRSIARDLGLLLKVGAHLYALRRTRIGDFLIENAKKIEEFTAKKPFSEEK
jgi:tRNA pseudouridine55 synthase